MEWENVSLNIYYYIQKHRVIISLEINDKCRSNQCPTFQECGGNSPNYRKEVKLA
jgi:hypothetical protein